MKAVKSTDTRKKAIVAEFKKAFKADKVTDVKEYDNVFRARLFQYVGNKQYSFLGQGSIPKTLLS